MAEGTLIEKVKSMIGVTGSYQDQTIQLYIDEVKQYMLDGGVSSAIVEASTSAGVIARGVTDLWNYGAGEGELSPYFMQRVIQLALKSPGSGSESGGGGTGTNNYNDLTNKPQIEGVELAGNKMADDLGLQKNAEVTEDVVHRRYE